MAVKWFKENDKDLITTIYDSNITLNKACALLFDNSYTVMLGVDYDDKLVYIKPLSKELATRGDILETEQYKITVRSSYARVSNIAFVNEIKKIIGDSILKTNPKKYYSTFDNKEKTLIIDLSKEVNNG